MQIDCQVLDNTLYNANSQILDNTLYIENRLSST